MTSYSAAFLLAATAITFAVAGALLLAHDLAARREQLRGRVDLLTPDGGRTGPRVAARTPSPDAPTLASTSALRGDVLEFARRLEYLGIGPQYAPTLFGATRAVAGVVMAGVFVFAEYNYLGITSTLSLILAGCVGAAFGYWLPHNAAERMGRNRKRAISRGLPDAMELLVIAVEAGLSLEDAVNRIVIELRESQRAISEELAITAADLRMLPNRDDALHRLAARLDMPSVNSVVTTLSQTLKYGTPLAQALRVVAQESRNDALLRLEERANRMPVLLTIPMIVFILPSLFLIIGGPAFLTTLDVLTHWGGR